jgi:hypothetical protein
MATSGSARRPRGDANAHAVFVDNDAIRLHVLDDGRRTASSPPVLVVPGMGD